MMTSSGSVICRLRSVKVALNATPWEQSPSAACQALSGAQAGLSSGRHGMVTFRVMVPSSGPAVLSGAPGTAG